MKKLIVLAIVAVVAFGAIFAIQNMPTTSTTDQETPPQEQTQEAYVPSGTIPTATIEIADYGTVVAELYPEVAPTTVANFIELAQAGYYDGLTFHRVIQDFMIQGGDPSGDGTGGPGYAITGEFAQNGYEGPILSHEVGVLSMARTQNPDSAGSQFFIVSGQATHLDGQYAAFGKVVEGLDLIEQIQQVETNKSDAPTTPVVISKVTIELNGYTPIAFEKLAE